MGTSKNRLETITLFIKKAKDDLEVANILLDHGKYGDSCYYSQQVAEKATKALLVAKTGTYPKDHVVSGYFSSEVFAFTNPIYEEKLRKVLRNIVDLEEHWLKPKYPYVTDTYKWDPTVSYAEKDAKVAIKKARFVLDTTIEFLREEYGIEV